VAVVAWTGNAESFNAASYNGNAKIGIYTFLTRFFVLPDPPANLGDGWGSTDLIMGSDLITGIPEPDTCALGALGVVMLLRFRHRRIVNPSFKP
jgi:hypothetical protein